MKDTTEKLRKYKLMAGMTQKELKKSYFHCGPF